MFIEVIYARFHIRERKEVASSYTGSVELLGFFGVCLASRNLPLASCVRHGGPHPYSSAELLGTDRA